MQRLSGLDASFLYFETPSQLLHVCVLLTMEPSTVPGGYNFDTFKAELADRIRYMPPLRRKLHDSFLNLDHPVWVEDEEFDINRHVHRIAVPSPGSERELGELVSHVAGLPLDRAVPLWDIWVIEGLQGGEIAVFAKMHHSTVDGVSGANIISQLCSLEPEGSLVDDKNLAINAGGYGVVEVVLGGLFTAITKPFSFLSLLPGTVSLLPKWIVRARRGEAMPAPFSAPRTRFNSNITGHRTVSFGSIDFARVRHIKNAFECTVNDVVLALASSALRRFLDELGELPSNSLVAMAPMSVHGMSKRPGTNHVSGMFMSLATAQPDPLKRLQIIARSTRVAKEHNATINADLLTDWAQFAAPSVFGAAVRMYSKLRLADRHPVVHNLVISNVPGPNFPMYFLGARITSMYPMGPVFHGAGLNLTVISMDGGLFFGFIGCEDMCADLWPLQRYIEEAADEYEQLANDHLAAAADHDDDGTDAVAAEAAETTDSAEADDDTAADDTAMVDRDDNGIEDADELRMLGEQLGGLAEFEGRSTIGPTRRSGGRGAGARRAKPAAAATPSASAAKKATSGSGATSNAAGKNGATPKATASTAAVKKSGTKKAAAKKTTRKKAAPATTPKPAANQ